MNNRKTKYEVQLIELASNNNFSLIQGKLDRVLDKNSQVTFNSDRILSQLAQINTQTIETIGLKLSQENVAFKSKLDQLPEQINCIMLNSLLVNKIKKVKIDKKIPILHTRGILKLISYDNNSKCITCSGDKTIIVRNYIDNTVIKTLNGHKNYVWDLLLLSDGRLASCSEDKTIKIWNLTNGNCEQTLIGHSDDIYCLLELPNSILLSGSFDKSIGLWDISQKDQEELHFYHQVKNDKQSVAMCMILINVNELAVSSYANINIYSFDNITKKSFNVNKTLKGHTKWVNAIKLMDNSTDLLVSCSEDKDCRIWSISQENCLRIFKGHSNDVNSIQILSDKIFASASEEIIFWNIDSTECIHSIKPDQ